MNLIKYTAGLALARMDRQKFREIFNNFTIPDADFSDSHFDSYRDRLIRYYIACKAQKQEYKGQSEIEALHKNFWSKVDKYFVSTKSRADDVHIPAYRDIVSDLSSILTERNIKTVCEFGVGDGKWLNYLSQQWTGIKNFIGIDISEKQIERNARLFPHFTFKNSDLMEYVKLNATQNTLYHTCGGVLEYISENSLKRFFRLLKDQAKGSMIFLIEPLYGDYDITKEISSKINGFEYSYTHNYVYWLKSEGIAIIRQEERIIGGGRMHVVVAQIE